MTKYFGLYHWFPLKKCCHREYMIQTRTPGLFKEEWSGSGMIALCSKTYFCKAAADTTTSHKVSSKGIQKKSEGLLYSNFKRVLQTGVSSAGVNTGIRMNQKGTGVITYSQTRTGLSYFYGKRKVHEDGIHTDPLDL